jgi:hypothetical protein
VIVAEFAAALGLNVNEGEFAKGDKLMDGLRHAVEIFIGVEAIRKVGQMVSGFVESAVAAKRLGERIGDTAQAVQELGYAAQTEGASADDLQVSMQHLAVALQELQRSGTGPAADGMRALGVSAAALKNKKPSEVLGILADHFAKLPDGSKKTAAAMDLFGRSGTALIPLLNKGSAGIADLRAEAEKLGVVIGEDAVKNAEKLEKENIKLHASLTGIKNQAISALLPAITELVEQMSAWIAKNRDLIESLIEGVVTALTYVGKGLAIFIQAVGSAIGFLQEHKDLAEAVLVALGTVITAFAVQAAIDWLLAFWPIPLIIIAIAGVAYGVKKLWDLIKANWHYVVDAFHRIKDVVVELFHALTDVPLEVFERFKSGAENVKKKFEEVIDWIKKKINESEDWFNSSWFGKAIKWSYHNSPVGLVRDHLMSNGSAPPGPSANTTGWMNPYRNGVMGQAGATYTFTGDINSNVTAKTDSDPVQIANASAAQTKKMIEEQLRHARGSLISGEKP